MSVEKKLFSARMNIAPNLSKFRVSRIYTLSTTLRIRANTILETVLRRIPSSKKKLILSLVFQVILRKKNIKLVK